MQFCILSIDLGTTYFKFCLFDERLNQLAVHTTPVTYCESNEYVEFDAEKYWSECKAGIKEVIRKAKIHSGQVDLISLTGQAESIVLADQYGNPLCNAISWSDSRSTEECEMLSRQFGIDALYATTGLPQMSPTWPATKLLWMRRHNQELFRKISRIFLIKDFITFKLSQAFVSEYSVFSFSCLFDQARKKLWKAMCDYLEIAEGMLPELVEPGTIVGSVRKELADELHVSEGTQVCVGALDHVAGMIGTGNTTKGVVNETTGTVQAIALKADSFMSDTRGIEYHYGAQKDTHVQFLVSESGGVCLQWFRDTFLPSMSFSEIDDRVAAIMKRKSELIFLPYITGCNSPEYDKKARGVFYGINAKHGIDDFARAVMEASGFLLRKNIDFLEAEGETISEIYSIGGASHSDIWCRMKADITGKRLVTFSSGESTPLGAAILAAVSAGHFSCIEEAVALSVRRERTYAPRRNAPYDEIYDSFVNVYDRLFPSKGSS